MERKKLKVMAIIGTCTFLAGFFIIQQYFYSYFFDKSFELFPEIFFHIAYFFSWGVLIIPVFWLGNSFRIEKKNWIKNVSIHLVSAVIIAILQRAVTMWIYILTAAPDKLSAGYPESINAKIIVGSFDSFVTYWFILGAYYSFDYYQQYRENKTIRAQLEAQLAQAHLQALKMQLHPHFLFNTLHTISSLMDDDIKAARRMITRLSELLRQTLDNIGVQEVPLNKELNFLKSYLEIEQTRFHDRLSIFFDISPETLDALVPNLILQPLVENAIRHGVSSMIEGGQIRISSQLKENQLIMSVADNGTGDDSSSKIEEGLGIKTTRKRLQQLYGSGFRLEIIKKPEKGFQVIVTIPHKKNTGFDREDTKDVDD